MPTEGVVALIVLGAVAFCFAMTVKMMMAENKPVVQEEKEEEEEEEDDDEEEDMKEVMSDLSNRGWEWRVKQDNEGLLHDVDNTVLNLAFLQEIRNSNKDILTTVKALYKEQAETNRILRVVFGVEDNGNG